MVLDDKQEGEKMWAFEVNNITKAIRNIYQAFISKDVLLGIETKTGTTALTMPSGTKEIIISYSCYRTSSTPIQGDLILKVDGKLTATFEGNVDGVATTNGRTFTISGDNINVTSIGSEAGTASYTAYYFS